MKHTLPWNVTGIPPEAREIARSAAHREGASVGEWLTRRIMTEEARKAPAVEPADTVTPPLRYPHEQEAPRSDIVADATLRRIDEAFRNLAHRLENNERAQMEAQRAMSAAATEINAATRDQSAAFQHLTNRILHVERQTDTGPLRDAVRGLHQGLSRLAEEIAKTRNESSGKFTALSSTVEMLAEKMAASQDDSTRLNQAFEEKLAGLDARVQDNEERIELTQERVICVSRLDETVTALESRVNSIEQRVQVSLGHYLTGIERGLEQISERLQQAEQHGRSDGGIAEAVRSLTARLDAMESETRAPAEVESEPSEITLDAPAVEDAAAENIPEGVELPPAMVSAVESAQPPVSDEPVFAEELAAASQEGVQTAPIESPAPSVQPPQAAAENYLAQARRAARPAPGRDGYQGSMRSRIRPDAAESGERRRMMRSLAAGLLVVTLVGTGALLTRSNQSSASALTLNRTNLIALNASKPKGATSDPAAAPAQLPALHPPAMDALASAIPNSVAAASVFPLSNGGVTPLAQLMAEANSGEAKAEMQLGLKYADGDGVPVNETQAAFWLQKAAEAGQALAQYRLGTLYERGRGVAADPRQALRWYGEAANHGNRRAMHNLAVVYADGAGTEKNFLEAARWFKDAAELGLTDSQFNLAVLYERGLGVKESLTEAYKWYAIAAASGDAESKARVAALASQIAPADRDAADKAAKAYRPRPIDAAANNG